jgi:hypothetical protein
MRYVATVVFMLASSIFACSQGPCTEARVKAGKLLMAIDVLSYTPSYGKPVNSRAAFVEQAKKKIAGRTNIEHSWESDRRVVASTSADMAYEHGTIDVGYNEDGKQHTIKLVILAVYMAKGNVCERVAQTIHRLEEDETLSLEDEIDNN